MSKAIKATHIELTTTGLLLPDDFRLERARIVLDNSSLTLSPFYAPNGIKAELSIVVKASDIETYLNKKQPSGMSNFRVKAENGVLKVVGIMKVILPIEVGIEGRLEFKDGKLNFVPTRAEVAGANAPKTLVADQLEKINPLIDLTGWPVQAVVNSIELNDGLIRLEASLSLTADVPKMRP